MALTGRQLAGACAALGLALGVFWPSWPSPHLPGPGIGINGGCPFGYGGGGGGGDGAGGGGGKGDGALTPLNLEHQSYESRRPEPLTLNPASLTPKP
jgi:hypothetical protein